LRNKADTRHTQTNCGKKLRKALWIRHKTATPTATNTQQHALKQMIEKLPKAHTQTNCGKKLRKALWIRHKTATPTAHAILAKSDHNKHPTQQHIPKAMIEKLPKITLT